MLKAIHTVLGLKSSIEYGGATSHHPLTDSGLTITATKASSCPRDQDVGWRVEGLTCQWPTVALRGSESSTSYLMLGAGKHYFFSCTHSPKAPCVLPYRSQSCVKSHVCTKVLWFTCTTPDPNLNNPTKIRYH